MKQALSFLMVTSWQNFLRRFSLSFSVVSVLSVSLFSLIVMMFLSLITDTTVSLIHEKVDISIDLKEGISASQIDIMKGDLGELDFVSQVQYVSKEDALQNFNENYKQISGFLEEYNIENPFNPSLQIITKTPKNHQDIIYFLSQDTYRDWVFLEEAKKSLLQRDRTQQLLLFTKGITSFGLYFSLFFLFIAFLIIFNTIRILIFYRRSELELMYLIWSSRLFTRGPFYFEALYYALFASIISLLCFYPIAKGLSPLLSQYLGVDLFFFHSKVFSSILPWVSETVFQFYLYHLPIFFGIIFLIGFVLSAVSIKFALYKDEK